MDLLKSTPSDTFPLATENSTAPLPLQHAYDNRATIHDEAIHTHSTEVFAGKVTRLMVGGLNITRYH